MIIWIDGVLGVGKTTIAEIVKEKFLDSEVEILDSDVYFQKALNKRWEDIAQNHRFLEMKGTSPQNDDDFISFFRELIEKKDENKNKKIMVTMALTEMKCKEGIWDYLVNIKKNILHIILYADKEVIKLRIQSDKNRKDKETALYYLNDSMLFLEKNFNDALWINTNNKDEQDIANEIVQVIKHWRKTEFGDA